MVIKIDRACFATATATFQCLVLDQQLGLAWLGLALCAGYLVVGGISCCVSEKDALYAHCLFGCFL